MQNIVDAYFHCNGEINRKIAARIFEGLNQAGIFIAEKKYEELDEFLPASTIQYLDAKGYL